MITPVRTFIVIATLFGLCFIVATPPIRFPDEQGHYLRVARVAADLFGRAPADANVVSLPKPIAEDFNYLTRRTRCDARVALPFGRSDQPRPLVGTAIRRCAPECPGRTDGPRHGGLCSAGARLRRRCRRWRHISVTVWAARLAMLFVSVFVTAVALMLMPAWARLPASRSVCCRWRSICGRRFRPMRW